MEKHQLLKIAIEIVDLPIENGGSFHSYVKVYQRVTIIIYSYIISHFIKPCYWS